MELGRVWFRGGISKPTLAALEDAANHSVTNSRLLPNQMLRTLFGPRSDVSNLLNSVMPNAFPVRLVTFNKSSDTNWGVPWHQDRIIAVKEKCDVEGFHNWSEKRGVWHCEPPQEILDRMLFVCIHLDPNTKENGAMEIALGSHAEGKVEAATAASAASRYEIETCCAAAGDVLVLNMLTLHRSSPTKERQYRRVLRVDFANFELPEPLEWTD